MKKVPVLRFPEFLKEWDTLGIEEVLERISQPVDIDSETMYQELGVRSHGKGIFHKKPTTGGSIGNKRVFWVQENAFIVNIVFAWEQAVAKTTSKEIGLIASHRFPMYQPKDNKASIEYVLFFFLTKKGKHLLELASPGGAGRNKTLGQKTFNELKITLPSFPEQTKIANFLTSVDTKIQQLRRKKELLEQYKKGSMQKLFSQEIRFKDEQGNEYPEWEEKKLGDMTIFHLTNSFSRALLNYSNGEVKNIHYGDIHTKFKSNFSILNENVPYINSDVDLSKVKSDAYCQEGDVVIADASEDYLDIGKSIEIINLNGEKLLAGLHTYILRDKNKKSFAIGFKGYLLQCRPVRLQIMKMATGVSVLGISKGNLSKIKIPVPSLPEQIKIADFFTAIDTKLNLVDKELDQLKAWKTGLLQQLFV